MTQQLQGGQLKIMVLVRNIEDYMLTPALYKTIKMLEYHESGENPGVFSKPCRFKVFGSNRMLSREQIMETMPFILQYTSNGTFLQQLSQMGKTVNFEEVFKMLSDGSRTGKSYNFIRDLTPQEQQQLSQPPPEVMMQAQQKDKELQAKMQIESMKAQSSNDPRMKQMELEVEAQKAQFEMAAKQQDMELKKQLAQMQLQQKQMEMQLKAMEAQFKLQSTAQQAQLDSEIKQQQHAFTIQQQADQHALQQQQAHETHEAEKERVATANEQDLEFTKKSNDLKIKQMQTRPAGPGAKAKTQQKK
jgi:ribosomal protein L31